MLNFFAAKSNLIPQNQTRFHFFSVFLRHEILLL